MKEGLLPANMHRRVNTKAARPKMTGINVVGRSISWECSDSPQVNRYCGRTDSLSEISASAGSQTDIKAETGGSRERKTRNRKQSSHAL